MASKQPLEITNNLVSDIKSKVLYSKDTDAFSRDDIITLLGAHEALSQRLDRIVKISDGYQYELKNTTKALQEALDNVKILSGYIPICAACKKVRSADGYWKQIEQYIMENSEADISHGLCPECAANYMHLLEDVDKKPSEEKKAQLNLFEEGMDHPVIAHYLTIINNKHFSDAPLYDDLVDLLHKYIRLEQRMQRIVRISDKYQSELHEIREKFEQEAKLDYLTGLANRREMYRILETEIKRIDRYGGTFSLILFDFDQFKDTNDKYGHEVGDKILQKASILIQEKLRQQDVCARWGGEEFLVIQPEGSAEGVFHCAERLRKALVDNPLMYGSVTINISISLGIALYRKGESPEECLLRADKSLYAAKAGGRNRTGPLDV